MNSSIFRLWTFMRHASGYAHCNCCGVEQLAGVLSHRIRYGVPDVQLCMRCLSQYNSYLSLLAELSKYEYREFFEELRKQETE